MAGRGYYLCHEPRQKAVLVISKSLSMMPCSGLVFPLGKPCCDGEHEPPRRVRVWHRAGLWGGGAGVGVTRWGTVRMA